MRQDGLARFVPQSFNDEGFVLDRFGAQVFPHLSAGCFPNRLIEQFQHHPFVVLLPQWVAGSCAFPGVHIQPHDLFEVRDDDPQDAARLQHSDAFRYEAPGLGFRKMFEHMGVVNHVE